MSQSGRKESSPVEQILDLLLDALLERPHERKGPGFEPPCPPVAPAVRLPTVQRPPAAAAPPAPEPEPPVIEAQEAPPPEPEAAEEQETASAADALPPALVVSASQAGRMLFRLLVGLFIIIILVNVPINREGYGLAQSLPGSGALIVRDGLLVKTAESAAVFVLQDNKLRWVSSLEAFDRRGYRWQDVHVVEDSFLLKFEMGWPVHVLLMCNGSPHIYALEKGQKRWIKDIPTFEASGYVWEDVKTVSCSYLRDLPDGPSIPEDAGPPPQP